MSRKDIRIPADVPPSEEKVYIENFEEITRGTGRLMLFAGDQKIEHLNSDFRGTGIAAEDAEPEHFFRIANKAEIGVFATQAGLISLYGSDYPNLSYLVKLNSKTNLVKTEQMDPISKQLISVDQVVMFKENSSLKIRGIGYTIYLGSEYEREMLHEAEESIFNAHQHGLIAILWIYPRGKAVKDERNPHLIAGATGVAACLGADFVKVNYPEGEGINQSEAFKEAVLAAGRCGVLCAGGKSTDPERFLQRLYDQIHISGARGNATGRNIHQKPLDEAVRMCNAISAITYRDTKVAEAMRIYQGE
ncbi:aldolase [candidate division WOR-3 bacterium]|nr:aldolase [candidate division WOR-3 bacterium]